VSSLSPGAKWALYVEDQHSFYHALFGDNTQTGVSVRPSSQLPWSGPHQFRVKFYCINGSLTLRSFTITGRKP
jgi:hypothetical protein